jgi:hypothetical protein
VYIVEFINQHAKIPDYVDGSQQFQIYKKDNADITYLYFEHYDKIKDITIQYPIKYYHTHQFMDYSRLDYTKIIPLVKKYFSPSKQILNNVEAIKNKYQIDYDNTIAVYYRGTDKCNETRLADFDSFYNKIKVISNLYPNKKIIIQTDTAQFIDYINAKNLKNIIIFNENSTSYSNKGIHIEKMPQENGQDMINLFSIFLILSKCNYIICGSSNVSMWMMFYRENSKNVHQFLNGTWYKTVA